MKRILAVFLMLVFATLCFSSCGGGTSVSIYAVLRDNEIKTVFLRMAEVNACVETISYEANGETPAYSYEIYYERAEGTVGYQICERLDFYALYAYGGTVYTETAEGICAVIPLTQTYLQFIDDYFTGDFPFSAEYLNQISSKKENGTTYASYYSAITPQHSAALSAFSVDTDDTIITDIEIGADGLIRNIIYSIGGDGTEAARKVATRTFSWSKDKQDVFSAVSTISGNVEIDIIYVGEEKEGRHVIAPSGVMVGFDTGTQRYRFFYDEACENIYSYKDGIKGESITLYAKAE